MSTPQPLHTVTIYSRKSCHLCESALHTLLNLKVSREFELRELFIDGDTELEKAYGEQVPVILIDGKVHDFFRVDPERFLRALAK